MQVQNALSHRNDNAANVPRRELAKLIYGRDSVFARNPTPEQVISFYPFLLHNLYPFLLHNHAMPTCLHRSAMMLKARYFQTHGHIEGVSVVFASQ